MAELASCPFCGGLAETTHSSGGRWDVGCLDEECLGFLPITTFARQAEAIAAWNRRPNPPAVDVGNLVERLRDERHIMQGDGLAALQDTCEQAAALLALQSRQASLPTGEEIEAAYIEYCRTHGGSMRTGLAGFRAAFEVMAARLGDDNRGSAVNGSTFPGEPGLGRSHD